MTFTPGPSNKRSIDLSAVIAYVHFMFEDTSSVECGLGLPRIAYSQIGVLELMILTPGASKIRTVDMFAMTEYDHSVLGDTSRAGCGHLLPRTAYSQIGSLNWRFP